MIRERSIAHLCPSHTPARPYIPKDRGKEDLLRDRNEIRTAVLSWCIDPTACCAAFLKYFYHIYKHMQKAEELRFDGSGADRVLSQGRETPCYWRVTAVTHGVKPNGGEENLAIPASRCGRGSLRTLSRRLPKTLGRQPLFSLGRLGCRYRTWNSYSDMKR